MVIIKSREVDAVQHASHYFASAIPAWHNTRPAHTVSRSSAESARGTVPALRRSLHAVIFLRKSNCYYHTRIVLELSPFCYSHEWTAAPAGVHPPALNFVSNYRLNARFPSRYHNFAVAASVSCYSRLSLTGSPRFWCISYMQSDAVNIWSRIKHDLADTVVIISAWL